MTNTFNRQPITFSAPSGSGQSIFAHTEFKGISVQKNYVTADPSTFVDAENVYTDEHGVLVSRAPFKFYDGEGYIVDEWRFGRIGLRLHRLLYHISGESAEQVTDIADIPEEELFFVFVIRCYTHETISGTYQNNTTRSHYIWQMPVSALGWDFVPKVTCVQIEEKVFIWFAGIDFLAFNTTGVKKDGKRYFYFEDAVKYLYFPICKLVVNGIESDLETRNFLTETYRRRHQYSVASSVDFNKYIGKRMSVNMTDASVSKYLYDVTVQENQDELMIYPYSAVDNDCYVDIVQTSEATVVLKYYETTSSMQISFDGKYFRPVPGINNILGNPLLTRDGFYIVAFTTTGVAKCKLVAQETTDFVDMSDVLIWKVDAYARNDANDLKTQTADSSFIPIGYFETIDNFVYMFRRPELYNGHLKDFIYGEWLRGADGRRVFWVPADFCDDVNKNDFKLTFYYLAGLDTGPTIGVAAKKIGLWHDNRMDYHEACLCILQSNVDGADWKLLPILYSLRHGTDESDYVTGEFVGEHKNTDLRLTFNKNEAGKLYYHIEHAYPLYYRPSKIFPDETYFDNFLIYEVSDKRVSAFTYYLNECDNPSKYFKIYDNTLITERYISVKGEISSLPDNGELNSLIDDKDRVLRNNDNLFLALETDNLFVLDTIIHKVDDTMQPIAGRILSEDIISTADNEYYRVEKLGVVDNAFVVISGEIKQGQFIRLVSTTKTYPQTPEGWTVRDDWPWTDIPKPVYITTNGFEPWKIGDVLPTGPIMIYGVVNIKRKIEPLSIGANGVWYNVDGMLWTSQQSTDVALELDEYVNAELDDDTYKVDVNIDVPDFHAIMNENYFVFTTVKTGHHLLEVTSTRRDEEKLFSKDGADLLLYLPKSNEQKFSNEITNLHPLSDTELGIFTENDIWYITMVTNDDGTVAYSSPIKSKLPLGCRKGDGVITALDGQAIIFPTSRGIAALAPQDFIATTEKTLTYLSDTISGMYDEFYANSVMNLETRVKSQIAITTYKYWIFFYKYLDREILFVDTRTGGWWRYTTPYPIHSIIVGSRLRIIMQLDTNPALHREKVSLLGVSYLFTDKENGLIYEDDVTFGFHSGTTEEVIDHNTWVGDSTRTVTKNPMSMIPWHFTSQRMHFNQINNYKAIKGITLNLKGVDTLKAKLWTKAYRDLLHPEKIDAISIPVNEMRTFTKRLNIVRVANFQYTFENDVAANLDYYYERDLDPSTELEPPHQLVLDALTIKYEVKERIR